MNRDAIIFYASLSAITGLGIALRVHFTYEPLWIDELHTAWSTDPALSLPEAIDRAGQGNQTPLYFAVVWAVQKTSGFSILALRSVSLVASLIAMVFAGTCIKNWTGSTAGGLLTTLLLAIDFSAIFYGSEARPYALVQALAIIQSSLLLNEINTNSNRNFNTALAIATASLVLTHLTTLLLIFSQLIFTLVLRRHFQIRRLLASYAAAGLLLAFCLPVIQQVLSNRSDWSSIFSIDKLIAELGPVLTTCLVVPAIAIWFGNSCKIKLVLLATCALLPLILAATIHATGFAALATHRYVCWTVPLACMFAGIAVGSTDRNWLQALFTLGIAAFAVYLNPIVRNANQFESLTIRKENWESAASQLKSLQAGKQELVFLFANLVEDHRLLQDRNEKRIQYLIFPLNSAYRLPPETILVPMPTITRERWHSEQLQTIIENGGCKIVVRGNAPLFQEIINDLTIQLNRMQHPTSVGEFEQDNNVVRIAAIQIVHSEPANANNRTDSTAPD